jgi:hypothetical protein
MDPEGRIAMGSKVSFEEQVRVRAYEIFIERAENGGAGGSPEQDWLQAEAEVRSRQQPAAQAPAASPRAPATRASSSAAPEETAAPASPPRKSVKTTKPTSANRRSH